MMRRVIVLALMVLAMLLMAACSGTAQKTPAQTTEVVNQAASTPVETLNPPTVTSLATPVQPQVDGPPDTIPAPETSSTRTPTNQTPTAPTAAGSQNTSAIPDPAQYQWSPVANGFDQPLAVVNPPDGSGRLFVVEQGGRIKIEKNGQVFQQAFLDISDKVTAGGERGLLGLAFHPNYPENGFFYVNYTDRNGNTVIARFQVSKTDPNQADPASEKVLLQQEQPFANHNGGSTVFGPDGFLYLGLGDGGSAGDPHNNAQSLNTLLGKILRIDMNGGDPYEIPADNPFAKGGGKPEIWAYGLRNPWRFSFDMKTGDLYIGDVGQNQWEEVDFVTAGTPGGLNFGWNYFEGNHTYGNKPAPSNLNAVPPVVEYDHSQGCSISGGVVYRGKMAEWSGVYFYADYCSGKVWGLLHAADGSWNNKLLFENAGQVTSFGQDQNGEVYLVDQQGTIYQLTKK